MIGPRFISLLRNTLVAGFAIVLAFLTSSTVVSAQVRDLYRDSQPFMWWNSDGLGSVIVWLLIAALIIWVVYRMTHEPASVANDHRRMVSPGAVALVIGIILAILLLGWASPVFAQTNYAKVTPENIVPGTGWEGYVVKGFPQSCVPQNVEIDRRIQSMNAQYDAYGQIIFSARALRGTALGPVSVRINCKDGRHFLASPFAVTGPDANFVLNRALEAAAEAKTTTQQQINALKTRVDQLTAKPVVVPPAKKAPAAQKAKVPAAATTVHQHGGSEPATPAPTELEEKITQINKEIERLKTIRPEPPSAPVAMSYNDSSLTKRVETLEDAVKAQQNLLVISTNDRLESKNIIGRDSVRGDKREAMKKALEATIAAMHAKNGGQ